MSFPTRCAKAFARYAPGACVNIAKRPCCPHYILVRCALVVFGASAGAEDEARAERRVKAHRFWQLQDVAGELGMSDTAIMQRTQPETFL